MIRKSSNASNRPSISIGPAYMTMAKIQITVSVMTSKKSARIALKVQLTRPATSSFIQAKQKACTRTMTFVYNQEWRVSISRVRGIAKAKMTDGSKNCTIGAAHWVGGLAFE